MAEKRKSVRGSKEYLGGATVVVISYAYDRTS